MKSTLLNNCKQILALIPLVLGLAGCATTGNCPPPDQLASLTVANEEQYSSNAHLSSSSIYRITSRNFPSCKMGRGKYRGKIAPGPNVVIVETFWSNWYKDETVFIVNAEVNDRYTVVSIELKPGQDLASVRVRPESLWEDMRQSVKEEFLLYTAPTWAPFALIRGKIAGARPHADRCFVWIEDVKSGERIFPADPGRNEPATVP